METIFKSTITKLSEIPELKWIDHDFGQLELENSPVIYPCALVDVPDIDWSNSTNLEQQGDTVVTVRLGFKVYDRTSSSAPTSMRERAAEHFSIIKKVIKALHGHEDEEANFNTLLLTRMQRGKSVDPRTYTLIFGTALFTKEEQQTILKENLDLEIGFNQY